MNWLLLILSLPTSNATARQRAWRALKASGAAALRDGVYLLPGGQAHRERLQAIAAEVIGEGGEAHVLATTEGEFAELFDHRAEFGALIGRIGAAARLAPVAAAAQARALRRELDRLAALDFFPGEAQRQARDELLALESRLARGQSPGEPRVSAAVLTKARARRFRGRTWVTRARPWVDRLACAWLIRRFIDPQARFLWLADPTQAPRGAVGYDFDGADFTHVDGRVSFEAMVEAFDLQPRSALRRVGQVVHGLDMGGALLPECEGVERVLAGMRQAIADDDALALAAAGVFEGLFAAFHKEHADAG